MNMMNEFVKHNVMGKGTAFTENGAISYGSIGTALLDQFGKAGTARGREYNEVWAEQSKLWSEDAESALRFPFYLRMITRKDNIIGGDTTDKVQKGQGARDEAFKRLLWVAANHPDKFYNNLWILPIIGSWKDLWTLMFMARHDNMPVSFKLDEDKFFETFAMGISDKNHKDLVKKYMPRIRSEKKCTTPWATETNRLAKDFAKFAGWTYSDYRGFKSTGKAHEFQKAICSGLYSNIEWSKVPGKALLNLVSGKFLDKHNLTADYIEWLKKQPCVKFNGYAFELMQKIVVKNGWTEKVSTNLATKITVDKQFDSLIKTASMDGGAIKGNVLCALDTSGSMSCVINGTENLTSFDVCVSLGVYFSELNKGAFHNVVAMFDSTSRLKTISGTFSDKINQIISSTTAWGSTNFQSLIDLIVRTRVENKNIPLEDFPKTLLVVSDMQFNPVGGSAQTNYNAAMARLRSVFPKEFVDEFKIVWWYCAGRPTSDYPSTMDDAGTYMFSGFDPAVVSFLLGGEEKVDESGNKIQPSMEDIVNDALHQEVLELLK